MSAVAFSIIAAVFVGANKVFFRNAALRGVPSAHLLLIFYIVGCLAALLLFPMPALLERDATCLGLLVLNGLIWAAVGITEIRVYRAMKASISAVFDSLLLVLLTAAGIILFGESLPISKVLGVLCIAAAIGMSAQARDTGDLRVFGTKLLSICLTGVAISINKYLATRMPIGEIVILEYTLPGFFLLLFTRPQLAGVFESARKLGVYSLLLSFCSLAGFACTIYAFAHGSLAITSALIQTSIIFTFLTELAIVGARGVRLRPAFGVLMCTLGAIVVAV